MKNIGINMDGGFEKCEACDGTGIHTYPSKNWDYCNKCKGTGRISWLEKIFKKDLDLSDSDWNLRYINEIVYLSRLGVLKTVVERNE